MYFFYTYIYTECKSQTTYMHNTSVDLYLREFKSLTSKLVRIKVKIPHEELIKVLLNGLLNSYDNLVQNISTRDKLPTFEKLAFKQLHKEGRRLLKATTQVDKTLYVKTKHYQNKFINEGERRTLCATTIMKLDTSQGFTRNPERNKATLQIKEIRKMLKSLSQMKILLHEGMSLMNSIW